VGVTRALYAVRTLPSFPARPRETWRRFRDELFRQRFTLDGMLSEGFALLEERPGEELVLGTVGRFWRARGELCANSPDQFRAPAPSGTAKAAWSKGPVFIKLGRKSVRYNRNDLAEFIRQGRQVPSVRAYMEEQ
jgi:hypothetical protein